MKAFLKALNITPYGVIFNALFFVGMLVTIWEIQIYRNTLIDYRIPTLLWFGAGMCLTPALRKTLAIHINTKSLFLQVIYNIVTWGGILTFVFMAINFYFKPKNSVSHTFPIVNKGSLPSGGGNRCRMPYVLVDLENLEKEIIFPCDTKIDNADSIILNLETGLFGYSVIVSKKLKDTGKSFPTF